MIHFHVDDEDEFIKTFMGSDDALDVALESDDELSDSEDRQRTEVWEEQMPNVKVATKKFHGTLLRSSSSHFPC